jgi:hypothetical protein
MAAHDDTGAKSLLGHLLKLARQQSHYETQNEVAHAVGVERSAITRAEAGSVTAPVLGDILAQCGISGIARVAVEGVHRLARREDDRAAAAVVPWYEVEARAHTLRYWNPLAIPGLFETAEYAYEIYRAGGRSHERSMEDVAARMARQAILDREDAPTVVVVLWQHVLTHQIGTPLVMRNQLGRLLDVSERPGVVLQVLPASLGANMGLGGSLALASLSGEPDVLLTGGLLEDSVTNDAAQVRAATATFEVVRGDSASRAESRAMITEAMTTWESKDT